ncbi:3'-5' exonuclease [Proteus terrae]|uniref:3'-5' exonuclease n=1 Tax=Proteus terrae TaxID=1574161 RepID=UPI0032DA063C
MKQSNEKYECKHAIYSRSTRGDSDILFIKENIIGPDGKSRPNKRMIKDFKRSYYLTKPAYRNHKDKKDYEEIKKLQKFTCAQHELTNHISRSLGQGNTQLPYRQVVRNPYVYGADLATPSIIKHMYEKKFPGLVTPFKVSVFDIETDVVGKHAGKNYPIMASLSFKDKSYTFVIREYMNDSLSEEDRIKKLHEVMHREIGDTVKQRNLNAEFEFVDHPADGFVKLFNKAHEWQPDFITGWNVMDFDVQVVIKTLEDFGINPADVLCDPDVPKEYRQVDYFQGKTHKVKDDGKNVVRTPLANYEKWPYVNAPATFRWADSMCAYYYLRTAKGKELNYKLDTIAQKVLDGIGKLSFPPADGYHALDWHEFMQTNYKYEYVIYNLFDCIVVEMMDEKTKDLSMAIPAFCGISEYRNFTSQPTRIAEDMHYKVMENGYIWGTTSDKMRTELDDHIQSLGGWIVMLPTELVARNGKPMFAELPNLASYVRTGTNDIDVEGAYPTGAVIMNVGKQTTWIEMTAIEGVDDDTYRRIAVDLASGGKNNACEIARNLYKAPSSVTLIKEFIEEKNLDIKDFNDSKVA